MPKKYTFLEFLAATNGNDFDNLLESQIEPSLRFLEDIFLELKKNSKHSKNCINTKGCNLCKLERLLKEYFLYTFDESLYREMNFEYI